LGGKQVDLYERTGYDVAFVVTLGADNGKNVQILTGIKPGDRVVTEGAYQVRLASASVFMAV